MFNPFLLVQALLLVDFYWFISKCPSEIVFPPSGPFEVCMYVCMCNYYVWCIRRKWLTQYNGLSFVEGKLNCTVGTVSMQSKYHTIYIMSQPTVLCCVVFMCYRMGRTWSSVARVANPSCSRWCWHHHPDVYLEQYISRHGSLEQGTQVDSRCHCSSQGIRNLGYRLFYL